jgi:hypothetical protein
MNLVGFVLSITLEVQSPCVFVGIVVVGIAEFQFAVLFLTLGVLGRAWVSPLCVLCACMPPTHPPPPLHRRHMGLPT